MSKSVVEHIQELFEQANVESAEFNELVDESKKIAEENSFLKLQINTLKTNLENTGKARNEIHAKHAILDAQHNTIFSNAEKHMNAAKQAYRIRDQMKDSLDTATELLKVYKAIDTPKKIREKYKKYKDKVSVTTDALSRAKDLIKSYRKEIDKQVELVKKHRVAETQNNITTVWSNEGDNLMVFPARLTMQIGDTTERQLTLLYMNNAGCAKLIAIDEDGNTVECTVPEEGLNPKPRTLEVAGELLRRWKRNGWKLSVDDLDLANV